MSHNASWIIFSYHLALETSTLRVRAWRILKRIGALPLQQSVCVVPMRCLVVRKLRQLQQLILEAGGEVTWIEVCSFATESETLLIDRFKQAIAEDYLEFIAACSLYCEDSLTDLGVEIKRLQKWLNKIKNRDYFDSPYASMAMEELCKIENYLNFRKFDNETTN